MTHSTASKLKNIYDHPIIGNQSTQITVGDCLFHINVRTDSECIASGHWFNEVYYYSNLTRSMKCKYDKCSIDDNPTMIIEVAEKKKEIFNIELCQVDPDFANQMEIFGLISHFYQEDDYTLFEMTEAFLSYLEFARQNNFLSNKERVSFSDSVKQKLNWNELYNKLSEVMFQYKKYGDYSRINSMLQMFARTSIW